MPKHRTKVTASATARGNTNENDTQATSRPSPQCLTLLEDGITRCCQPATEGHSKPERCKEHHTQYHTMYKKYKDASKVVDDVEGGAKLPTWEEIGRYTDRHAVLERVSCVCDYLEAIRVEKAGREIHQKRFFLEAGDGHEHRLELLERKMMRAEDILDALQERAYELYKPEGTLHTTNDRAPTQAEAEWEKQSRRTTTALGADTDPEDKYDMDPTSLILFAIDLFDIRKDREEAFEYFVRAWHQAHSPFATMKLVTHYLPLQIPLNLINADEEKQRGTISYYLQCIGGPPGLALLFLEAGLLHLEGAASVLLSASSSTTSSIRVPPLPQPGEGGAEVQNQDREIASRYFDCARALYPGLDVPCIPDNGTGQAEVAANATARGNTNENNAQATSRPSPPQCLTLLEDEITRCCQPATEGHPKPERCKKHHTQYRILYKKYKDASKVVDDVKGGAELPTREEIGRYTDWHAVLEKVDWMCDYLEAVRVEKAGREIHSKRFFLEVDDGHQRRLELLKKRLLRAEDVLDALQSRANELYNLEGTLHTTIDRAPPKAEAERVKQSRRTTIALDMDADDKYSSNVIDNVKGGAELPTEEEIGQYTDYHAVLEQVSWVCDYLEAIRMEREIHQNQFFLEVNDGHQRRLELLERKVVRAEDVLDALQRRADELYKPESTLHPTIDRTTPKAEAEWVKQSRRTTVALDMDLNDEYSSKVVDDVKGGAELPTEEEIGQYTDCHAVLEKVSWVCDYLEAIRVEQENQISLEADDGHERCLELLERKMARAEDVLDALQRRADELYKPESTLHVTNNRPSPQAETEREKQPRWPTAALDTDTDDKGSAELPTEEEISQYTDCHAVLEKVGRVCDYLEAIREEKSGREIRQKRFPLEPDDGHKRCLELLERKIVRAEDVLDALQRRADELYEPESILQRTTATLDTDPDPEDKYNMDPTSLTLFAIDLFDIRKDREEAFEYFVRAWHQAHLPFATMKLVTHYLPLQIPLNVINADEEKHRSTISYYLQCIGGPPGLAQLFLEAGLLHLEGAASVLLSAPFSTTSSIRVPHLPWPGEGGAEVRNRDREMASRYFDRARALHPELDVPRIPDDGTSQAALGSTPELEIPDLEMPDLEMPSIGIQPTAPESMYSGQDSLYSEQQTMVHRRRQKKKELDEGKPEKEDIENAWDLDVPSLVGAGTALLVAGVIGALRLSWRRN